MLEGATSHGIYPGCKSQFVLEDVGRNKLRAVPAMDTLPELALLVPAYNQRKLLQTRIFSCHRALV